MLTGMRRAHNVRDPVLQGHFRHGHRNFDIGRPIVQAEQQVVVYIDHEILTYLVIAPASDAKSSKPSDEPSIASLDRSGWGIIPSTLCPSLNTPAMQLMAPLGLANLVTSPDWVQ